MSDSDSGWTTVTKRRNKGSPVKQTRLKVTMEELKRSPPVSLGKPKELRKFSTMLGTSADPSGEHGSRLDADLQRYTVQQPCKRRLCEDDLANKMEYVENRPLFDLNQGYGMQIAREDDKEFMELLLRCLEKRNIVVETDFVCHQNLLTHLSVTPYELDGKDDQKLMIVVQKIKEVFYMFKFFPNTATEQLKTMDAKQKRSLYWGMKFDSYVRAKPGQAPDPGKPLNLNEEFCSVVTRQVGQHSILLRGDIDCIGSDKRYVKLTINQSLDNEGHKNPLKPHKLIKWWLQCSTVSIDRIVCGFRDDAGMVQSVEQYKTDQLPSEMPKGSTNVCMSFLDEFLSFVKKNVHAEGVPHVFQQNEGSLVFDMHLDEEGRYKFLPLWFVEHVMQQ